VARVFRASWCIEEYEAAQARGSDGHNLKTFTKTRLVKGLLNASYEGHSSHCYVQLKLVLPAKVVLLVLPPLMHPCCCYVSCASEPVFKRQL
jgi:hypothetical protein